MASDYWVSTQHLNWENAKKETRDPGQGLREEDNALALQFSLPEPRLLNIYLQQQIAKLGRRLNIRQNVLATALIFVRRLYTKIEIRRTNPYLILATAFYVACKIEECPQHIKLVVTEAKNLWPDFIQADTAKLGECEFFLISQINAQLVVHHPYRSLTELQTILSLTQDELTLAWSVVNDHYVTDLPLRFPPHIIATMAVVMTITIRPSQSNSHTMSTGTNAMRFASATASAGPAQVASSKAQRLTDWLTQSGVDVVAVAECTQEMISLYVVWEQYSDRECRDSIARFVRRDVMMLENKVGDGHVFEGTRYMPDVVLINTMPRRSSEYELLLGPDLKLR